MDGRDTWEYKTLFKNQAELAAMMAKINGVALKIADELVARDVIGSALRETVDIRGPHVTETMRAQPLITAMLSKIEINRKRYHDFRAAMLKPTVGMEKDIVNLYVPKEEKGKCIYSYVTVYADRTRSRIKNFDVCTLPVM